MLYDIIEVLPVKLYQNYFEIIKFDSIFKILLSIQRIVCLKLTFHIKIRIRL